jgi:hypothetical protein
VILKAVDGVPTFPLRLPGPVVIAPPAPTEIEYAPGEELTGTDGLYAIPPAPPPPDEILFPPVSSLPPAPPPATTKVSTEVSDGLVTVKVPEPVKV